MTETRKLLDDGTVNIVTETTIPQYEARIERYCDIQTANAEMDLQCIKDNDAYIYCASRRNGFEQLSTEPDFEPEEVSAEEDFNLFKEYIANRYPKENVKCYYLMAYVHSGTSFYLSEEGRKTCQFDSGIIGFIAIRKDNLGPDYDDNNIAKILTDAWEGDYTEYSVYNNLTEEYEDSIVVSGSFAKENEEAIKNLAKKYDVSFDAVEIDYK